MLGQSLLLYSILSILWIASTPASAQPFGVGIFNANVPFGGQTSLTIATSGGVGITLSPNGSTATGNSTVTVTSSDVVGYKLYITAPSSTNLSGTGGSIPASANTSGAPLATNTWGYNTDNSSNYVGITTANVLLLSATGPFTSGNVTQVYYGVKVDNTTKAGSYSSTVMYTAVPQTS